MRCRAHNGRGRHLALSAATAAIAAMLGACAPALKTPPPIQVLGAPANAPGTAARSAQDLLADGEREYARRPDLAAVARAYQAFLAAARADEAGIDALLGAARAAAWLLEHEPDAQRRDALATEAVQVSQWCVARAPGSIECKYRLGLAVGQQARERRLTAKDGLPRMFALLEEVAAADPRLDRAGAHRTMALVLLRAPGWPLGPGDPERALEQARAADGRFPDDADNLAVLGEALARNDARAEARAAYTRALEIARARAASGDPDAADAIASATRGLEALGPD